MSRYYGTLGFVETMEEPEGSGVWKPVVTEHPYFGELVRNTHRWQNGVSTNDDLAISNELLVTLDGYVTVHLPFLRYVEFMGAYWKVTSVQVESPHLRLTIGGVYNRQDPTGSAS